MTFEPNKKLSRPINHKATAHSAEINLETFEDVFSFVDGAIGHIDANRQVTAAGAEGQRIHTLLKEPFQNILVKREELLKNADERVTPAEFEKSARAEIKRLVDGRSFTRNSEFNTVYERINQQFAKLGFVAAFLGTTFDPSSDSIHNSSSNQTNRSEVAAGYSLAVLTGFAAPKIDQMDRRAVRDAAKSARDAQEATARLRDELREDASAWEQKREAAATETDEKVSKLVKGHTARLEGLYTDHAARMEKVEKDFKERLIMEAPAEYWEKRAKQARWNARWAFLGFVLMVFVFVVVAATAAPDHLSHIVASLQSAITVEGVGDQGYSGLALIFSFALISTPAVMALWTLMLVSRIFRENLHLANDAKHRNMLITTYLALAEDENNPISKDDREFALNAIFSVPSEASADDAVTSLVFPRTS